MENEHRTLSNKEMLIELKGWYSSKELSKFLNITEATISNCLNNKSTFALTNSDKLKKFFNKHVHENSQFEKIEDVYNDWYLGKSNYLVDTPDGFQYASKFIKKDDGSNAGKKYYKKAKKYYKKKDYNNAYKWAKKSAALGYKGGYFGVGLAYEIGKGVEVKNKKKALEWYLKAAELGHTQAQANAGRLLMFDNGSESEKWYTKAAEKGHLQSQNNLGYMYERGMGSSMWGDKKKAYKYYLMAAKQGSGVAQRNVCLYHWKGDGGAKKSSTIAKEWCQKAVDGGYSKAHALLERVSSD